MSMAMPPEYAPGLPTVPGGGDPMMGGPAPDRDALNAGPVPGEDGMAGLLAALQGGGGDLGGDTGAPTDADQTADMSSIEHIQQAMKHLMMAMAKDEDEERGVGITKGMGALQAILGGEQKKQSQLSALSGPGGG